MKLSLVLLFLVAVIANAEETKSRSYDDIDSKFSSSIAPKKVEVIKESPNKPKAIVELIDEKGGEVTVYALDALDTRITSGELEKLSVDEKNKALDEINTKTAKEGKKLATYSIPKRSLDKDEATSAFHRYYGRRWAFGGGFAGYRGGFIGGGCFNGFGGGHFGWGNGFYGGLGCNVAFNNFGYGGYFGGFLNAPNYYYLYGNGCFNPCGFSASYTSAAYYW